MESVKKKTGSHAPQLSFSDLLVGDSPAPREEIASRALKRRSNINIDRTFQLLNDAVGTPGGVTRTKTPIRSTTKSVHYTPKHVPAMSQLEFSMADVATPAKSMMSTPGGAFNYSTAMAGGEVTTTNITLLNEEEPGLAAASGLYSEFMERMRECCSEHDILTLLEEYEVLCKDQTNLLSKLVHQTTPGKAKFSRVIGVLHQLSQEKATWSLLHTLYKDRLETEAQDEAMAMDMMDQGLSDKQLMMTLYEQDDVTRQAQLVIDWLESLAETDIENYFSPVEFATDRTVAWENTLHTLNDPTSSYRLPLVTELDPDAPIRQKHPLHDLDKEDDERLLRNVFFYMRAGRLDRAQEVCAHAGQSWRAATLEGWRLYHDPNYTTTPDDGKMLPVEGNMYRDVWKSCCWKLAEDERLNTFERAIYATLSGCLPAILNVCQSWEDYVWAYFKVLVDSRVEQHIRSLTKEGRPLVQLPENYGQKELNFQSIFRDILATPSDVIRKQGGEYYHVIQQHIILGDYEKLIVKLYNWVIQERGNLPQHLIRFMAHLILFFQTIGLHGKDDMCCAIIEAYVQELIEDRQLPLVATYVSKLPQDKQVVWYARFLTEIHDKEERRMCLQLAEEEGLDVPVITKTVVENIRSRGVSDFDINSGTALEAATTEEDRIKIEAIDWLVFDPSQRSEAMRQANAVMRVFLAMKKHGAAREVFNKIPSDSIDTVYKSWHLQTNSAELPPEDENAIREYLCIQAYLDAHDSFNDWFKHFHHGKPTKPEFPTGANFTERVAYEHRERQYETELDRWNHSLDSQTKMTVDRMYNVLLFVDGGWMVDTKEDPNAEDTRSHQMSLLRQLCLPTIAFLLHSVLHSTEQYKECLQLVDVIASERHLLYQVFNREKLQKLLRLVQESSVKLLDRGLDPLGYSMA